MLASAAMVRLEIGPHTLVQDGELVTLSLRGPMTLAHVEQVRARVDETLRFGRCFMLIDMSGMTGIETAARRYVGDWGRMGELQINGAAVYGSSFAMRVMTTLMLNAIRVLGRREIPAVFVADEAAARAWIAERSQR